MNSLFLSKKKPMIYLYVTKCQARQKRYLKSEIILKKTDLFYYFKIAKNKAILLLMAAACWSYLGERLVPVADCGEDLGGPRREV